MNSIELNSAKNYTYGNRRISIAEREAEGIEKGEVIGRNQEGLKIAREMLADHQPIDKIVKYTKLSIERS